MAKYGKIFERVGEVVYAREQGGPADTRVEIDRSSPLREHILEDKLWGEIRRAAKTNTSLQAALDHAILIYKLSKDYNDV